MYESLWPVAMVEDSTLDRVGGGPILISLGGKMDSMPAACIGQIVRNRRALYRTVPVDQTILREIN